MRFLRPARLGVRHARHRRPACPGGTSAPPAAAERVVVTTDVLKLTFDTEGGSLVQSEFIQHDDLPEKDKPFVLLRFSQEGKTVSSFRLGSFI